ncbi:MAG: hypothetical protein WCK89_24485 [bacterium]
MPPVAGGGYASKIKVRFDPCPLRSLWVPAGGVRGCDRSPPTTPPASGMPLASEGTRVFLNGSWFVMRGGRLVPTNGGIVPPSRYAWTFSDMLR